jgi:hypothetical protein
MSNQSVDNNESISMEYFEVQYFMSITPSMSGWQTSTSHKTLPEAVNTYRLLKEGNPDVKHRVVRKTSEVIYA